VALELGSAEIAARLLAITMAEKEGRAPMWSDLYLGKDAEGARRAREQYAEDLVGLPLRIEEADAGKWTAADLSHRVGALRRSFDPAFSTRFDRDPLVILDYLQLVGPEEERQDLRECIRTAAIKARNVARHGATVLLLSSVSRENAKLLRPPTGKDADKVEPLGTGDPSRLVGLGKESGEIEFSADTVLSLGTEAFNPRGTTCHLAAAKVRAGLPAWVRLTFNGSSFSEAAGAAPQREEDDL
jgi:hypothetical protein